MDERDLRGAPSQRPHRVSGPASRSWHAIALALIAGAGVLLVVRAVVWGVTFVSIGSLALQTLGIAMVIASVAATFIATIVRRREWAAGYTTIGRDRRRRPDLWVFAADGRVISAPAA